MRSGESSERHPERRYALWASVAYAVLAAVWIFASDWLLEALVVDPASLSALQTAKGWAFVALTALLLYLVILRRPAYTVPASRDDSIGRDHRLQRIIAAAIVVLVAVVLMNLFFALARQRHDILADSDVKAQNLVRVIEEHAQGSVNAVDATLASTARALQLLPGKDDPRNREIHDLLRANLRGLPFVRAIWVLGAQGRIIHDSDDLPGSMDLSERPYFRVHRDHPALGMQIGQPIRGIQGIWFVPASRRLSNPDGSFAGVITAAIEPRYFERFFESISVGRNGVVGLARPDGTLISRVPIVEALRGQKVVHPQDFVNLPPSATMGTYRMASPVDGTERIYAYRRIRDQPLVVFLGLSVAESLASWHRSALANGVASLVFVLVIGGLGFMTLRELRRRSELNWALRESTDNFRQLAENIREVFWLTDPAKNAMLYVSPGYEAIWGSPRAMLLASPRTWLDAIHPEDRERVFAAALSRQAAGTYDEEYRIRRPDGTQRWVRDRAFPVRDESGEVYRIAGIAEDITERKRAEALDAGRQSVLRMIAEGAPLRETLETLARVVEAQAEEMLVSILLLDPLHGRVRHGAAPSLPHSFTQAIDGEPVGDNAGSCGTAAFLGERVITEDISVDPRWEKYREAALAHGLRACWSTPIFDQQRQVLGTFALYFRAPGTPTDLHLRLIDMATHTAAIAIARSRTDDERAQLLHDLAERESLFRSIFENAAVGMTLTDPEGRLIRCNPAFVRMLGYSEAELAGRPFAEISHPDDAELNLSRYRALVAGEIDHFQMEKRYLRRDGTILRGDLNVSKILSKDGGVKYTIGMIEDITARHEAQQALRASEQRLRGILESMTVGFLAIDRRWRLTYANPRAAEIVGRGADELVGKTFLEAFPEAAGSAFEADYRRVMDERRTVQSEHLFEPWDRWFEVRSDPTPDGIAIFFRDITESRRAEQELVESQERYRRLVEVSPDAIYVLQDGGIAFANAAAAALFGAASPANLLGRTARDLTDPRFRDLTAARIRALESNAAAANPRIEQVFLRLDGTPIDVEVASVRFTLHDRPAIQVIARDITERKRSEARIQYLATHDGLTDLPNRNLVLDRITQAIAHVHRTGRQIAVLFLDLDRFKVINDAFGHPFGDTLLKSAGERLRALVREGDTVARHGGDEFLILLADLRRSADVYIVAQKIIDALAQPFTIEGRAVHLSGSIGASVYPQDGRDANALISNADVAMYRSKDLGRNTYQFFTREMSEETKRRVELETRLRGAIDGNQLHLAYQPKVDLATGRITGCEALLRWKHPELGAVSPAHFIPIAEDSGLIVPIGDWVLRTACLQNKAWQDAGLPRIVVSVNLSTRQFLQQDIVAWTLKALEETHLRASSLELELTESLIAQDVEKVVETVNRLKEAGVKLSIDDFGTGYSSLSYLKRFRVDTLKIDQSFVRNMLVDPDDATIAMAVISLAHSLRFRVIAEGVETAEHCQFLRLNRCDEIQGYYFSRPVPATEMEAMLRSDKRLAATQAA